MRCPATFAKTLNLAIELRQHQYKYMANPEDQRLGYGEPVTLNGEEADILRDLFSTAYFSAELSLSEIHQRMFAKLVPVPEVCETTRSQIIEVENYFQGILYHPDEDDPGYQDFEELCNEQFATATSAFADKPAGCEMTCSSSGTYECARCDFIATID
jgi:hypothetical protein